MRRLVAIGAVLSALCPATAAAAQRVATAGELTAAPQLAGTRVAWQEQRCLTRCDHPYSCSRKGSTSAFALRIGEPGSPPRTLVRRVLNCATTGLAYDVRSATAVASATRVALVEHRSYGDDVGPPAVDVALHAGAQSGGLAPLYSCSTGESSTYGSFEVALDGDALAYDSDACGDSRSYVVRDLATGQSHPVPQPALSSIYSPRLAGRYFAYLRSPFTLVVYDWVAGHEAYRYVFPPDRYPQSLDVQDDGKVAVHTRSPDESSNTCISDGIAWLSPAEPAPHELPVQPCLAAIRLHGDKVWWMRQSSAGRALEQLPLSGAGGRTIARYGHVRDYGFDADGTRAAFALATCGGGEAIYVKRLSEKAFSAGSVRCPAKLVSRGLVSRHGVVRVTLDCPRACTGEIRIGHATKAFGSAKRGRKAVPVRLRRGGRFTVAVTTYDRANKAHTVRRRMTLR